MGISIKKNYMYNMIYEIVTTLIPLITIPYIARVLGTEGVGTYTYTLAIASIFVLFAHLGVRMYGNRSIAITRENTQNGNVIFSGIFIQQLFFTFLVCIAYLTYINFIALENKQILWLLLIYIVANGFEITWLFYGFEDFKVVTKYTIVVKVFCMIATFMFVRGIQDVWIYILILSVEQLCINLWLWIKSRKYVRLCRVSFKEVICHLKPCLVLFIPIIAVNVYRTMDKLMLQELSTTSQLGLYQSASQLQTCFLGAITALGTVTLPRISNMVSKDKMGEVKEYLNNSVQFSMFCCCAIAFGIAAIAQNFIPLFYGDEFAEATKILWILAPSIIAITWANVLRTQYLIPKKRDFEVVLSVCGGAIVNIGMNLWLIPTMQGSGAAIGTLCAEFTVVIIQCLFIAKEIKIINYFKKSLIFIFSGIIMLVVVLLLDRQLETLLSNAAITKVVLLLIEIFVGACVYLTICFAYYYHYYQDSIKRLIQNYRKKRSV